MMIDVFSRKHTLPLILSLDHLVIAVLSNFSSKWIVKVRKSSSTFGYRLLHSWWFFLVPSNCIFYDFIVNSWRTFLCANVLHFYHLITNEHLDYFQSLTIINWSSMNINEQVHLKKSVESLGCLCKSRGARSWGTLTLTLLRSLHTDFQSSCTPFHKWLLKNKSISKYSTIASSSLVGFPQNCKKHTCNKFHNSKMKECILTSLRIIYALTL